MRVRALAPLLFLSGAAALVLEVCWFRRMAQVAGGTAIAMSAVLAAVIGGMALGSLLFGRFADRARSPIRLYGALEIGVALFALIVPSLIDACRDLLATTAPLQFALSVLLLTPPAVLMGGTLPAAVAALREKSGRTIGWLYSANTLGAVGGTVAAGFFLIPAFGLADSMRCAALFSGAAGGIAMLLPATPRQAPQPNAQQPGARRALLLYATSGFLGLVAEVAFTRQLVLVFGSSTYAFSTMLAVFLLGIGIGGAVGTRLKSNHLRRLEWTVAITAALFSLSMLAVYLLPRLYLAGYAAWGDSFGAGLLIRFLLAAAILLPGTIGLGIAFPLAAHAAGRTARSTGSLYALNTLASVLGSTLAVFVFVPLLGPRTTVVAVALAAGLACNRKTWPILLITAAGLLPAPAIAREHLLAGVFFNPGAFVREGSIDERTWRDGVDIPFTAHGREATVSIWRWYSRSSVLIDGKAVATNQVLADVHHLSLLGHLPVAIHPDPKRVLVVGLGMGTTFRAVREHGPELLRVVEIEGAVAKAAAYLDVKPRDLVIQDARSYLKRTDETFDVITSDPIHPWVRGGGDLYTREYFEMVRDRLAKNGIACQWLPVYQMGLGDIKDIVRTFSEVFSTHAYFGGGDLILIGATGSEPPAPRPTDLYSLRRIGAEPLRDLLVAKHAALRRVGGTVLTDDMLKLEFSTPHEVTNPSLAENLTWIRALWGQPPQPYGLVLDARIAAAKGDWDTWEKQMRRARGSAPNHGYVAMLTGEDYLGWANALILANKLKGAEKALRHAEQYLPGDPRVKGTRAELHERRGETDQAKTLYRQLLELTPDSVYLKRKIAGLE